jgi:hypothetical protein
MEYWNLTDQQKLWHRLFTANRTSVYRSQQESGNLLLFADVRRACAIDILNSLSGYTGTEEQKLRDAGLLSDILVAWSVF